MSGEPVYSRGVVQVVAVVLSVDAAATAREEACGYSVCNNAELA